MSLTLDVTVEAFLLSPLSFTLNGDRRRQALEELTLMDTTRLEFTFKGLPVGCFEESEYPKQKGLYRYMPYRGPGHLQMHAERRATGSARCSFRVGFNQVTFVVLDCPEYGLLELEDFEFEEMMPIGVDTSLNMPGVMQIEELKANVKQASWFSHAGEFQERRGLLCLPTLKDVETDERDWDWLPTDSSAEDPIHGDSLRLLADSLGKQLERRETGKEVYKLTLESLRRVGESHPSFKVGPHNMLPAAKGAAAYAARMAALEILVSCQGFWCNLFPLYVEGFYPCGYTPDGQVVVF